jgi:hypothetical protein
LDSPDIPRAIVPIYLNSEINGPIQIHQGTMDIHLKSGPIQGECLINFEWQPWAQIRFLVSNPSMHQGPLPMSDLIDLTEIEVEIPSINTGRAKALIANMKIGSSGIRIEGLINEPVETGASEDDKYLKSVVFHLPNFWRYLGDRICNDNASWRGRSIIEDDIWKITIDEIHESQEKSWEDLQKK